MGTMALSPAVSLGFFPPPSPPAMASHSSLSILLLRARGHPQEAHSSALRVHSSHTLQASHEERPEAEARAGPRTTVKHARKKKPRSNFFKETMERWSARIPSQRSRFPWQEQEDEEEEEEEEKQVLQSSLTDVCPPLSVSAENGPPPEARTLFHPRGNCAAPAPWSHGSESRETDSEKKAAPSPKKPAFKLEDKAPRFGSSLPAVSAQDCGNSNYCPAYCDDEGRDKMVILRSEKETRIPWSSPEANGGGRSSRIGSVIETLKSSYSQDDSVLDEDSDNEVSDSVGSSNRSVSFPWESGNANRDGAKFRRRSNTEVAERTIPELELRRLRNMALRMKERTKVGAAGVTEALVESIHQKWKEAEVVKLKFEGPPGLRMKSTHKTLESRTGGIVIWRSGSSLVLYRGMTYGLSCLQSYSMHGNSVKTLEPSSEDSTFVTDQDHEVNHSMLLSNSVEMTSVYYSGDSSHELVDELSLDSLLDELGPRFKDWSGRNPLPVDADLLPPVVPGYKPPFRFLPYKMKLGLRNGEMTYLRRLARKMPPHFALGRSRMLQGLAQAIVKLWERSIIAKIAIKRGVLSTCNERMAEEIKKLTGGVLLSRNKEYIVFYRGNDFLVPSITDILSERQNLANARQVEEEQARMQASAFMASSSRASRSPHVAGTLAETLEAKTHWGNQTSNEEREKMMKEQALERHASQIRLLEKKLALAKQKVHKAEKALVKVQEFLSPAELPTDLETVTDEERFLYRKIGLKMKAFLSLGRRGVFDGTVENMHLNWKHRELVKIIVKGKSFAQVKHLAISLEAESGGILVSLDKTTKGYAIIIYRGKNYHRPHVIKPKNLLTKRQALARSIELQRREALNHHISNLREKIEMMKSELEQMRNIKEGKGNVYSTLDELLSDDDMEDEGEEAYLETYDSDDEDNDAPIRQHTWTKQTPKTLDSPMT
ncbi:hypothetical protein Taro_027172 [Colocasia esculenta]|uniref:CRM-domain containing factor CFM3, chloroplastic/mitochondrial n=1 Tax=Colocasia esculenta TaxID=4460 RepID=A0A843VDU8_COLES|nr:hypothetical protein [Colocasia esculenta]